MKVYVLPLLALAGMVSPALAVSPQVRAAYALASASEPQAPPSLKVVVKGAVDVAPQEAQMKVAAPVQAQAYPQGYARPVTYAAPVYYYVQQPTYSAYRPPVSYSMPSYSYAPSFGGYGGMSRGFSMPTYSGGGYGGGACGPSG